MKFKNKNEALDHSFSRIYASGITTMITLEELLRAYTQKMSRDLENYGINASDDEIKSYLSNNYKGLKQLYKRNKLEFKWS